MFLLMVRVTDPLMPRAMFGVLNTLLYFPSGAVYPQQGFPGWMQVIAVVDPFTYAVHAFKSLLLKNTGFDGDHRRSAVPGRLLGRRDDAPRRCCSGGRCDAMRRAGLGDARAACCSTAAAAVRRARLREGHGARDLPRARANVAAVNYHFGDKTGPLRGGAAHGAFGSCAARPTRPRRPGEGQPPEEQLRPRAGLPQRVVRRPRHLDPPADDAGDGDPDAGARPGRRRR